MENKSAGCSVSGYPDTGCIGCDIANGKVKIPGGIIHNGRSVVLAADPRIPIPGFLIITAKRHIQSYAELAKEERAEIGDILSCAEKAIKELGIADEITLVQEERSRHFHIWIFPVHPWIREQFGSGIQHLRNVSQYAVDHADKTVWNTVADTADEIRKYFDHHMSRACAVTDKETEYVYQRSRSVAVVVRDDKILMERVFYFGHEFYTLPGGGIEEGETPEQAVLRELKEECGLDGTILRSLAVQYKSGGGAEYSFEVSVPGDQEAITGYDPEESVDNPPLKEVLWMKLDEINERDRAFLWHYGLMAVNGFFDEIKSWGDELSYPSKPTGRI